MRFIINSLSYTFLLLKSMLFALFNHTRVQAIVVTDTESFATAIDITSKKTSNTFGIAVGEFKKD